MPCFSSPAACSHSFTPPQSPLWNAVWGLFRSWNVFALGAIGLSGLTSSAELVTIHCMRLCDNAALLCWTAFRDAVACENWGFDMIDQRCGKEKRYRGWILSSSEDVGFTNYNQDWQTNSVQLSYRDPNDLKLIHSSSRWQDQIHYVCDFNVCHVVSC